MLDGNMANSKGLLRTKKDLETSILDDISSARGHDGDLTVDWTNKHMGLFNYLLPSYESIGGELTPEMCAGLDVIKRNYEAQGSKQIYLGFSDAQELLTKYISQLEHGSIEPGLREKLKSAFSDLNALIPNYTLPAITQKNIHDLADRINIALKIPVPEQTAETPSGRTPALEIVATQAYIWHDKGAYGGHAARAKTSVRKSHQSDAQESAAEPEPAGLRKRGKGIKNQTTDSELCSDDSPYKKLRNTLSNLEPFVAVYTKGSVGDAILKGSRDERLPIIDDCISLLYAHLNDKFSMYMPDGRALSVNGVSMEAGQIKALPLQEKIAIQDKKAQESLDAFRAELFEEVGYFAAIARISKALNYIPEGGSKGKEFRELELAMRILVKINPRYEKVAQEAKAS